LRREPESALASDFGDKGRLRPTRISVSLSLAMAEPSTTRFSASSFEEVMIEHTPRVFRSLRYLGVPEADVKDAAQEVFLVVHRRLDEFRGEASISTWIYEICNRIAKASRRRSASRRDAPVPEPPVVPIDANQESDLAAEQARQRLKQMLELLPEEQRLVIVLHEIEELSMRDVANLVNCPIFTAYSRLRLARKRLEQLLSMANSEEFHV
jgi:RNA polymerase sigma-70 factor (ECF subfamily)